MFNSSSQIRLVLVLLFVLSWTAESLQAQSDRRRRDDPPNPRVLESRVEKAEESLVNEYKAVAEEFYKSGDREKAMALLKRLNTLDPTMPGLKDQIKKIQQELMEQNPGELSIDTRKQVWLPVGKVIKGKPVQLACAGDYKVTFTATLGPAGMTKPLAAESSDGSARKRPAGRGEKKERTQEDIQFVENLPLGCLAGVIVDDGKLGEPFQIGQQLTLTPKSDGILIVKTNLPAGCRCIGKLELTFSGYIEAQK